MAAGVPIPSEVADPLTWADWLELTALTVPDGNASHGDLERVLNRLGVDGLEGICTECMVELNRRVVATRERYPFVFSGTLLRARDDWRDYTPYVFCLLLSYCEDRKKKVRDINHEMMFEELSCLAARHYIEGDVIRFGHPRTELPRGFLEALTVVCGRVKEWTPVSGKTLRRKDDGLDLVAWKSFPDQQIGKIILFGHCASGADWNQKINELQPNDFCTRWLGGDRSPVVKSFFIPHRISPELFADRAVSAKLFFDRCRIAYWVPNNEFVDRTRNGCLKWCEIILKRAAA